MDDPRLMEPLTPANPAATPRKCRRHVWASDNLLRFVGGQPVVGPLTCSRCGRVRDEMAGKRGRRNASRGKRIQRERIEGLGGTNLAGNNENLDGLGLAFRYESMSGGSFSERYWRWLDGIPVQGDTTPVLIVTEAPGPGKRARSIVVVKYEDWRALHGEGER
jgi:hypothetical protein